MTLYYLPVGHTAYRVYFQKRAVAELQLLKSGWWLITDTIARRFINLRNAENVLDAAVKRYVESTAVAS